MNTTLEGRWMKLTMKNNYTFQKSIGYLDNPKMMSTDGVKRELARWSQVIGSWMEGDTPDLDQIAGLDGFLSALATDEVEYEEPVAAYHYRVGFEYYDSFDVYATSPEEADEQAKSLFRSMADKMPAKINEAKGCFKYLEQNDDERWDRLIEE